MKHSSKDLVTRRTALGMFASGAGVVLLAACGGTATPATSAPASGSPASQPASAAAKAATSAPASSAAAASAAAKPSAAPKAGGTLRFGQIGDLVNVDP